MAGRIDVCHNQPYDPMQSAGGGGYYRMTLKSGAVGTTFAAGAILFALQFLPAVAGYRMQLKKLRLFSLTTTAFGAAQLVDLYLYKCRGFTGADTSGTQVLPATLDQRVQTKYPDSLFVGGGDIRIASTATLSAGTRTPEAQPIMTVCDMWSSAIGINSLNDLTFDEHNPPPVLISGEGLEIQNGTAFGGTGKVNFFLDIAWMEEKIGTHGW